MGDRPWPTSHGLNSTSLRFARERHDEGDGIVSASAALFALPACAIVLWALLRSPLARRVVASPRGDRWHQQVTPSLGGIGIVAGCS